MATHTDIAADDRERGIAIVVRPRTEMSVLTDHCGMFDADAPDAVKNRTVADGHSVSEVESPRGEDSH